MSLSQSWRRAYAYPRYYMLYKRSLNHSFVWFLKGQQPEVASFLKTYPSTLPSKPTAILGNNSSRLHQFRCVFWSHNSRKCSLDDRYLHCFQRRKTSSSVRLRRISCRELPLYIQCPRISTIGESNLPASYCCWNSMCTGFQTRMVSCWIFSYLNRLRYYRDHGVFVPLKLMFPEEENGIPVVAMSILNK